MIELTRLNNTKLSINPYQIEMMESNPDTVILMNSGKKYMVCESITKINKKISHFISNSIHEAIVDSGVVLSINNINTRENKE